MYGVGADMSGNIKPVPEVPVYLPTLLQQLSDGCYHSGEALGSILGVSRTAVWKHLKKLEPLGLQVESVKGQGYRLSGGLDLLNRPAILAGLDATAASLLSDLAIFMTLDSTSTHAMQNGFDSGFVCLAEQQLAGRGRRGRSWVSPFGQNIYLSLVWHFEGGAAALEGLSLAVGVAIADALSSLGLEGVMLKWPNDILHKRRKLSGVLLEMSGDVSGACRVVVGIGLNIAMPTAVAGQIEQPWVDLKTLAQEQGVDAPSRNQVVAVLLNQLLPLLAGFQRSGFIGYQQRWQALDAFAGQPVEIRSGDAMRIGVARGVSSSGALRLENSGQIVEIYGGEVSLRGAQ